MVQLMILLLLLKWILFPGMPIIVIFLPIIFWAVYMLGLLTVFILNAALGIVMRRP